MNSTKRVNLALQGGGLGARAALAAFWTEATGYRVAADHRSFLMLAGDGVDIGLQQVPEPRAISRAWPRRPRPPPRPPTC